MFQATGVLTLNEKNVRLYEAMRSFVTKAMIIVNNYMTDNRYPREACDTWEIGGHTATVKLMERPMWPAVLYNCRRDLEEIPELCSLIEVLGTDPVIAPQLTGLVGTPITRVNVSPTGLPMSFLGGLMAAQGAPTFDEVTFGDQYCRMEQALYGASIEYEIVAPLLDFNSDIRVALDDQTAIDTLTKMEIIRAVEFGMLPNSDLYGLNIEHYAIRHKYALPKSIGPSPSMDEVRKAVKRDTDALAKVHEVLRALHLFAEGPCTFGGAWLLGTNWLVSSQPQVLFRGTPSKTQESYFLPAEQADALVGFWSKLQADCLRSRKALDIAIRRFSYAGLRENPEDRMIDLLIAAEALFLQDSGAEDRGELSFRLALRASLFIEPGDTEMRRSIFKHMKDAYRLRSAIVHGATPKLPNSLNLGEFCQTTEDYMRAALQKAVSLASQPTTPKTLVDWDSLLFG